MKFLFNTTYSLILDFVDDPVEKDKISLLLLHACRDYVYLNLDKDKVLNWIKQVCANDNVKLFHNAMYDVCWLRAAGVQINGHIVDTMVMSSLIDENRLSYTLNSISYEFLGEVKDEKALIEAAQSWGIDPKSEMYKLPAMYVGNYAEKDAKLTLELFKVCKETRLYCQSGGLNRARFRASSVRLK